MVCGTGLHCCAAAPDSVGAARTIFHWYHSLIGIFKLFVITGGHHEFHCTLHGCISCKCCNIMRVLVLVSSWQGLYAVVTYVHGELHCVLVIAAVRTLNCVNCKYCNCVA